MDLMPPDAQDERLQEFTIRVDHLEREVGCLSKTVQFLLSAVDPEDLAAALRIRELTPSNAQLKIWADVSEAPADLIAAPEERPW